jgi:hypothetical protein
MSHTHEEFTCDNCDRAEDIPVPAAGGTAAEVARVAGWRLGAPFGQPRRYCPECTGTDEDYWDRRTLAVAHQAGIDAGNKAWSG